MRRREAPNRRSSRNTCTDAQMPVNTWLATGRCSRSAELPIPVAHIVRYPYLAPLKRRDSGLGVAMERRAAGELFRLPSGETHHGRKG
jgi:hypothetical protein